MNLFTLSSIYHATEALLGKGQKSQPTTQKEEQLAGEYWNEVTSNIKEWGLLLEGKITCSELRKEFVHSHGIALWALGIAGRTLLSGYPKGWKTRLRRLEQIDWSRRNTELWEGRAMHMGRISASRNNIILTTAVLKRALGLALTEEEENLEQRLSLPS